MSHKKAAPLPLTLLKLEKAEFSDDSSGKLAMFGVWLEEAIDGGHRVLVFSQFTTMLALPKDKLTLAEPTSCDVVKRERNNRR